MATYKIGDGRRLHNRVAFATLECRLPCSSGTLLVPFALGSNDVNPPFLTDCYDFRASVTPVLQQTGIADAPD
eukprot:4520368-Prymnesium_polylepis.1